MELPEANIRFRIKRIPTGKQGIADKRYLMQEETARLFDGEVVVEEKVDGKQITKMFSAEFPEMFIIGAEFMKKRHSIFYNRLPDWVIVWDLYDQHNKMFWAYDEKVEVAKHYGFALVPLIFRGKTTLQEVIDKYLNRQSSFGDETQEGVVVKNLHNELRGKIVRHEFITGIELTGHWMRRKGLTEMNQLAPRLNVWNR